MGPRPIVSIIVPVYNGQLTIASCVESLLGLDFPADQSELIVVDNGSTDRTREILSGFGSRLRVVYEAKPGPAAARNAGVRIARGEMIAFTDADCRVDSGWLRHLLPPLCDPGVGVCGGRLRAFSPADPIARFGERIHDQRRAIERFRPPYAITANWGSRRVVLQEAGLFDEGLLRGSDSELAFRIGTRGYRLVYCHEAVVFHTHESTLLGLFREGRDHGRGEVMMQARGRYTAPLGARRHGLLRRLARSGWFLLRGPQRLEPLCQMMFDLGKVTGRLAERLPPTRSRSSLWRHRKKVS